MKDTRKTNRYLLRIPAYSNFVPEFGEFDNRPERHETLEDFDAEFRPVYLTIPSASPLAVEVVATIGRDKDQVVLKAGTHGVTCPPTEVGRYLAEASEQGKAALDALDEAIITARAHLDALYEARTAARRAVFESSEKVSTESVVERCKSK